MQQSEFVFAYGSNMDPAQIRERCPESDLASFVAEARGWELCFPRYAKKRGCAVGSIVKKKKRSVWGVVFAVTPRDLARLDRFEGSGYRRELIEVVDAKGRQTRVWTYFAEPDDPPTKQLPSREYIDHYVRGAKYFSLPEAYMKLLKSIRTADSGALSHDQRRKRRR
jgi:gamma-glutamylcyclotransferase (GGCT)/AIG2-like uncharacterized protein YtfP